MEMLFFMILKNQEFDIRSSLQIIFSDHADTDTVTTRSDVAGNAERKRIIVDIHFREGRRKHICPFFFLLCTKTGTCSTETQTFFRDTLETGFKIIFQSFDHAKFGLFHATHFCKCIQTFALDRQNRFDVEDRTKGSTGSSHPAASFEKFQCIDGNVNAGVESICFQKFLDLCSRSSKICVMFAIPPSNSSGRWANSLRTSNIDTFPFL